jgi:hypothetical protein
MITTEHNPAQTAIVDAPFGYTNRALNGSVVLLLANGPLYVEGVLLTGPNAGCTWMFEPQHLRPNAQIQRAP